VLLAIQPPMLQNYLWSDDRSCTGFFHLWEVAPARYELRAHLAPANKSVETEGLILLAAVSSPNTCSHPHSAGAALDCISNHLAWMMIGKLT